MKEYLFLFGSIITEVIGTLLLPTTKNLTKIVPTSYMTVCYVVSIYLLTLTLKKIPLAIAYASWAGLGTFSIALFSYVIYKQTLQWQAILGLFFIVLGVTLVNVFKT